MAKVQGKRSQRGRQKRKKKVGPEDSLRAIVVSSLLIGLAVVVSVVLLIVMPPKMPQTDQPPEAPEHTGAPLVSAPDRGEQSPVEAVPSENESAIQDQSRGSSKPDTFGPTGSSRPTGPTKPISDQPPASAITTKPLKPTLPEKPKGGGAGLVVSAPIERPPQPPPRKKGTLAIVLDDAGNNLKELEPFLHFPGPLTIAVLPGLPYSAEAAKRIRAAGKEVILHQPMEAVGGQNPGPGAIYADMSREEIEAVLKKNLAQLGPVAGMNNHQGSKITADERIMEIVLAFCRRNGIYYLDSRTTAETAVPAVAERMGIRIGERDVFVDNIQEKAAMIRFMEEGLQKAEKKGAAIVIGHVWSNELAATLIELYPELIDQGFSLTTVSRIMLGTFEDEGFGD